MPIKICIVPADLWNLHVIVQFICNPEARKIIFHAVEKERVEGFDPKKSIELSNSFFFLAGSLFPILEENASERMEKFSLKTVDNIISDLNKKRKKRLLEESKNDVLEPDLHKLWGRFRSHDFVLTRGELIRKDDIYAKHANREYRKNWLEGIIEHVFEHIIPSFQDGGGLLRKAIIAECEAIEKNEFLIWRSTNLKKREILKGYELDLYVRDYVPLEPVSGRIQA